MSTWVAISKDAAICVYQKTASQSLMKSIHTTSHRFISANEAAEFENRIAFIRDPLARFKSCFNFVWHLEAMGYKHNIVPPGVVQALSAPSFFGSAFDPVRWSTERITLSLNSLTQTPADQLNRADYLSFLDYALSGDTLDGHLLPQAKQSIHDGRQLVNKFYKLEDIEQVWRELTGKTIERLHSYEYIPVLTTDVDSSVLDYYTADTKVREALWR